MFDVGQKVRCVAEGTWAKARAMHPDLSVPVKGGIYTVREVTNFGVPGIRLVEIVNPPHLYKEGYAENAWAWYSSKGKLEFRPLTDISIFKEMLKELSSDNSSVHLLFEL